MNQWISIKEGLPKQWQDVWATDGESVWYAYFARGRFCSRGREHQNPITHWMPYQPPEPPKTE